MISRDAIQRVIDDAEKEIGRLEREAVNAATDLVRVRRVAIATGMRLVQSDLVRVLAEGGTTPESVAFSVGVTLRAHDPETGCLDCPLLTHGATCFVTDREVDADAVSVAPEWCPIRTGGVMVSSREALRKVVPL